MGCDCLARLELTLQRAHAKDKGTPEGALSAYATAVNLALLWVMEAVHQARSTELPGEERWLQRPRAPGEITWLPAGVHPGDVRAKEERRMLMPTERVEELVAWESWAKNVAMPALGEYLHITTHTFKKNAALKALGAIPAPRAAP